MIFLPIVLKFFVGGVWSDCFGQNAEAVAVAAIVAASNDPADGTPSIADLTDIGLTDVTCNQARYEIGIANANPVPTTLTELQAVIDDVNNLPFHTTIVEVTGPNGNIWMDRNLGATQVATGARDAAAYGDYYQWGRCTDGHEKPTSNTSTIQSVGDTPGHGDFITRGDWRLTLNDNLWQGVDGTNNPCPTGFRIPTAAEWSSLGFDNQYDANDSTLKLPAPGLRLSNSNFLFAGTYGSYWSSTLSSREGGEWIRRFHISVLDANVPEAVRGTGMAVRCIKD